MNFQRIVLIVALVIFLITISAIIGLQIYDNKNRVWPPDMCGDDEWACHNDVYNCYNTASIDPACPNPNAQ